MVTIRDVAKEAGVSVATASRAMNNMSIVTPQTRAKIEAAAKKLEYVPHVGARSLTRQKTDTIGVILPDLFGEYFSELIRGIDMAVNAAGKSLLLSTMHGSAEETLRSIRAMKGRVDGLLVLPPDATVRQLPQQGDVGLPIVLLNAPSKDTKTPYIGIDNYAGAFGVTMHLIDRGAERLVHIAGPKTNRDAKERLRGFMDAMAEGRTDDKPIILHGDFREGSGRVAIGELLQSGKPFDAIFAANDVMGIEAVASLRDAGFAVGKDVLIAGFDDIPLSRYITPALTTARTDIAELGAIAANTLLELIGGNLSSEEWTRILTPTVEIRASSGGLS